MSKKNGKKPEFALMDGIVIVVNPNGSVETRDDSGYDVKAQFLDRVVARAKRYRELGEDPDLTVGGEAIEFNYNGGISVGCQFIAFSTLQRIHRASQLARRRRSRK